MTELVEKLKKAEIDKKAKEKALDAKSVQM